ncbi:MAG TPA: BadF/BadG/BcrA/BcrD ATPase family protein [Steroidobacteraceae bacterium]
MSSFLGIDGGGTKTEFLLIDEAGQVLARHQAGSAYYLEIGFERLSALLRDGVRELLSGKRHAPAFAYVGLPAYGEDSALLGRLEATAAAALDGTPHRCGNDMICAWAGALGGDDGVNIVAGTGSIAYGEYAGRQARGGGWGELFSDEGSAYWIAREGLALFSRMSDGRATKGALHTLLREHFNLSNDLDICAAVYGQAPGTRSNIAQLAPLVSEAALQGDSEARLLFERGARELAAIVAATRASLRVPREVALPVSCSGSLFKLTELLLEPFKQSLEERPESYRFLSPRLAPAAGAALYAAKLGGSPLPPAAVARLTESHPANIG